MRTLTGEEARRFLASTKAHRLYTLYYLALHTDMREGELIALRWADVDLERGTIHIVRHLKTKTERRAIDVSDQAISVLRDHRRAMQREEHGSNRVFPTTVGTTLKPRNLQRDSKTLLLASGCPNIRFHDLRHTAATLMLQEGVYPKVVSERLGHATTAITMDLYQHVTPTLQREAAVALDRVLSPHPSNFSPDGDRRGGSRLSSARTTQKKRPAYR